MECVDQLHSLTTRILIDRDLIQCKAWAKYLSPRLAGINSETDFRAAGLHVCK